MALFLVIMAFVRFVPFVTQIWSENTFCMRLLSLLSVLSRWGPLNLCGFEYGDRRPLSR